MRPYHRQFRRSRGFEYSAFHGAFLQCLFVSPTMLHEAVTREAREDACPHVTSLRTASDACYPNDPTHRHTHTNAYRTQLLKKRIGEHPPAGLTHPGLRHQMEATTHLRHTLKKAGYPTLVEEGPSPCQATRESPSCEPVHPTADGSST